MSDRNEIQKVNVSARALDTSEIDSQVATAIKYPRDIKRFKDKLMAMANIDQETAEGCYYALPRGGITVDGPSVRLAEIALACYGNCVAQADVTGEDEKYVYATGQCRDLENNVAVRVTVKRRITKSDIFICENCKKQYKKKAKNGRCYECEGQIITKAGKRYNDDMIAVTANAACSIALRNAIFKVIPAAFIKPVYDRVKRTAVGEAKSLNKRRSEVIKKLTQFGVTEDRIIAVLERKSVDEVTFDDVAKLIGLGTAIKEGGTTVEEAFPISFNNAKEETQEIIDRRAGSEKEKIEFDDNPDPEFQERRDKQIKDLKKAEGKGEIPSFMVDD